MKYLALLSFFFFLGGILGTYSKAYAQVCAPTRIINQYACMAAGGGCIEYENKCAWSGEACLQRDLGTTGGACSDPGDGVCTSMCKTYAPVGLPRCQQTGTDTVSCTDAANGCRYQGTIRDCQSLSDSCNEYDTPQTYSCWVTATGPTPTAGSGSGSGTWGGCGCYGSGECYDKPDGSGPTHPSNECVTNPQGTCSWDPGLCRYVDPGCRGYQQSCNGWADSTSCCSGLTCNIPPPDTDYTCSDCRSPVIIARYCGTDPTLWCGQSFICNNGNFNCPNSQIFEVPDAPTAMSPVDNATVRSTGSPSTQLRCNASCSDNYDCGAYRVEARLNRYGQPISTYRHFILLGFLENGVSVPAWIGSGSFSSSTQNPRIEYRPPGAWNPGSTGTQNTMYTQTQGAGANMASLTASAGLVFWSQYDSTLVDFLVNGVVKDIVNTNTNSGFPGGQRSVSYASGPEKAYACTSGVCRLRTNPADATCAGNPASNEKFVPLSWDPGPTNASGPIYREWQIEIFPEGTSCADPNAFCGTVTKPSYRYVYSTAYTRYVWRVRAINNVCAYAGAVGTDGRWSTLHTFTIEDRVDFGSTVNLDNSRDAYVAGGICTTDFGRTAHTGGGNVTIDKSPFTQTVPVSTTNGAYQFTQVVPGAGYTVSLQLTQPPVGQPQLVCTCPVGCSYANVSAPQDLPFFVSQVSRPWYQTQGGEVAALAPGSGTSINNPITTALFPSARLSKAFTNSASVRDPLTVGALIVQRNSTVDLDSATGNQETNVADPSRLVRTSINNVCKENYDYFYRKFSMGVNPTSDLSDLSGATHPSLDKPNGKNAYYAPGNLSVNNAWSLTGNRKMVIFVNGDLNINANITVANNAFLAFIVKGNINIMPTVGTANSAQETNGQVQGVYIANGNLTVQSAGASGTDLKFVGEGIFAVCGNVRLQRDYQNGGDPLRNNIAPTSLFVYRPDLIQNTPDLMKDSVTNWKEVSP